ncbi:TPA: hypothetical protein EYP66_20225, partial [Candidatus Poribacteria bacterium]|nr:hypothetical protein [Candidatus Poribacteria bacterium]
MKKMERILIATDFSPSAQAATEVGISLAKKFDSKRMLKNTSALMLRKKTRRCNGKKKPVPNLIISCYKLIFMN